MRKPATCCGSLRLAPASSASPSRTAVLMASNISPCSPASADGSAQSSPVDSTRVILPLPSASRTPVATCRRSPRREECCMSSLFRSGMFLLLFSLPTLAATLKVCADPDNLPYSNKRASGFENRLAYLIGSGLHEQGQFVWARPRRGFLRERVNKGECDVLMSVPVGMRGVLASKPYLRSSYVFVTRADRDLDISSFDDPQLKKLKIGVQTLDDEYAPPAQALGKRGMLTNIVGYEPFGKVPGKIVSDVANGKLDTAVVWGPLAGFYARRSRKKLRLTPGQPDHEGALPFAYDLAVGVAKNKPELVGRINQVLAEKHRAISLLLTSFGI